MIHFRVKIYCAYKNGLYWIVLRIKYFLLIILWMLTTFSGKIFCTKHKSFLSIFLSFMFFSQGRLYTYYNQTNYYCIQIDKKKHCIVFFPYKFSFFLPFPFFPYTSYKISLKFLLSFREIDYNIRNFLHKVIAVDLSPNH